MKLIYCQSCEDVVRLFHEPRICQCGKSGGRYTDGLNAIYFGEYVMPIGIGWSGLIDALDNQPQEGYGERFESWVIPKDCPTMKKLSKEDYDKVETIQI